MVRRGRGAPQKPERSHRRLGRFPRTRDLRARPHRPRPGPPPAGLERGPRRWKARRSRTDTRAPAHPRWPTPRQAPACPSRNLGSAPRAERDAPCARAPARPRRARGYAATSRRDAETPRAPRPTAFPRRTFRPPRATGPGAPRAARRVGSPGPRLGPPRTAPRSPGGRRVTRAFCADSRTPPRSRPCPRRADGQAPKGVERASAGRASGSRVEATRPRFSIPERRHTCPRSRNASETSGHQSRGPDIQAPR